MNPVVVCEHVRGPEGMEAWCRVPGRGEQWAHCPCCGLHAVISVDDDLSVPFPCPYCDVLAVIGPVEERNAS